MVAQFSETHNMLAQISPASYTAEQNTDWIDMARYERIAIIIQVGAMGTTFDADLEIATDSDGSDIHTLKSITQLVTGEDDEIIVIELLAEEMSHPTGASSDEYSHLRLEVTPNGATIFGAVVLGFESRYDPVSITAWDEIVA